jgi:hypothetical protein
MPSYGLKLYNYVDRESATGRGRGEFQFDAPDDPAAIRRTKAFYAKYLVEYDYALLSDTRGRFVWEQGGATDSAGSGR